MTEIEARMLSASGRSAIAVWRLTSTGGAVDSATQRLNLPPLTTGQTRLVRFAGEEVVLARVSDDSYELTTHGGPAAAERTRAILTEAGVEVASAGESVESVIATAATKTVADRLLRAAATFDARLNTTRSRLEIEAALAIADRLRHVPKAVLVGRANVGKSSLTNLLLGFDRSVVFDREGVTRDALVARAAFGDWPCDLVDTAGFDAMPDFQTFAAWSREQFGSDASQTLLPVAVVSQAMPEAAADLAKLACYPCETIVVATHGDREAALELPGGTLVVDCLSGDGLTELVNAIAKRIAVADEVSLPIPLTARQRDALTNQHRMA